MINDNDDTRMNEWLTRYHERCFHDDHDDVDIMNYCVVTMDCSAEIINDVVEVINDVFDTINDVFDTMTELNIIRAIIINAFFSCLSLSSFERKKEWQIVWQERIASVLQADVGQMDWQEWIASVIQADVGH